MLLQALHLSWRDGRDRLACFPGVCCDKMLYQQWDVILALPQRRHGYGINIQAVPEVFPERSLLHFEFQITVSGCNDPNVNLNRSISAEPLKLTFLNHSEQLHLQFQRQLANLVEKDGAAVCQLETALLAPNRTRKRALFVSK